MKSQSMSLTHSFVFLPIGVDYGERAVALDDSNADAHKWFALLTGSKLLYEPNAEKIKLSYVYKVGKKFTSKLLYEPNAEKIKLSYVYKVGKKFTRHASELTLLSSHFASGLHQAAGAGLYFSMTRTSALKRFGCQF